MTEDTTARLVADLHQAVRHAQATGDHEGARAKLRAIQILDPGNALAESLLDGSARHCQMTVLFCDLVGSTPLAERLDNEDMGEVLRTYRTACAEVVERYEGFIEDRQGDGLLVRFGTPRVHEDDPRRAVLTGLGIIEALGERSPQLERAFDVRLAVRIAVHTGMVLIDRNTIVGPVPNQAKRLQEDARPDTVLISGATWSLVDSHFEAESHGPVELRGVEHPIETYTVLSERTSTPLEAATGLTRFAGRQGESAAIQALWQQALDGQSPPSVLVTGSAGIGKSRLLHEAARALDAACHLCQSSGYHTTSSLHAFRPLLAALCEIEEDDPPQGRLEKLRAAAGEQLGDLQLLAAALSIPLEITSPPPAMEASMVRLMALHAAAGIIRRRLPQPSMLLLEDLQWADESTLDLIGVLLSAEHPGVLFALSARDGFEAPWPDEIVRLELGPLPPGALETMATDIPQAASLGEDQRRRLIARSDGVPLYLEELVRGADALAWDQERPDAMRAPGKDVPPALRDPLLARLSSPGVDLALMQIAATIGRDVDQHLLQQTAELGDAEFREKLANLLAVGLLDRSGEHRLRFRHELIRATAYDTQLRAARREYHSRIADLLPAVTVGISDAGVAAFHFERAERFVEAIDAYATAALTAQELGAHKEATRLLTHVLTLLDRLPMGTPRLLQELGIRQARAFSAVMSGGYSSRECREDHARGVELCEELGLGPELLPSLLANWSHYVSCDINEAERVRDAAERIVAASGLDIPVHEMGLGVTGFFAGRFAESRELLLAFLDHPWAQTVGAPPQGWNVPNDPFVGACAHLTASLWISGEPERALEIAQRGLQRAATLPFPYGPFSTAYAESQLATILRLAGDDAGAQQSAERMIAIGNKHGFVLWMTAGAIHESHIRIRAGDASALPTLIAAVAQWRAVLASEVWCPYLLAELATAQALLGARADAYESLEEALAYARRTGAEFYTAEVLRIRGELRRDDGDPRGLADLKRAVHIAQMQGAVAFERRAQESLRAHAPSAL